MWGLVFHLYSYTTLIHAVVFVIFFSPIFQGYCSGIFMIKYWVVRILFRFVLDSANSKRNNAMHIAFSKTLGEWVKRFLLLKDLFPSWQILVYSLEYLPQTLRQKSNTCMSLCLVCKFGSSVTLFSNFLSLFDMSCGCPSLLVHHFAPWNSPILFISTEHIMVW